ncbi:MAG TPA: MFS transporter [Pseudonocardiaceae bacterium]|nr:MFS transporter [Pseudonocardiaceae bacterium]
MASWWRSDLAKPWQHTEFRALWSAYALSVVGDQLARVALTVLVFDRTNSAALAALTYALTMLPNLVAGVALGWLADRFPRRTVMVCCDAARAVLVGIMAIPGQPYVALALLLVVVTMLDGPFGAAQGSLLPVVLGEDYEAGQSIQQMTQQTAMLLGVAGAGLVVVAVGTNVALAIDAATFLASALLVWFGVRHRGGADPGERQAWSTWWGRITHGAVLVGRNPQLRTLLSMALLALFTVVPEGLAVPFAHQVGAGAAGAGFLLAADPLGFVVGSVALRYLSERTRLRWLGVFAVGTSVALLGYFAHPDLGFALGLLGASGICSAYQTIASTSFVRLVPDERRGQALGFARSSLIAGQGVGVALGGVLAQGVDSPGGAIAIAGAAGTVLALVLALAWARISPTVMVALRREAQESAD